MLGHWQISCLVRDYTTGLDTQVGTACRLLRLNWLSVLSLKQVLALQQTAVRTEPCREAQLQEEIEDCTHQEIFGEDIKEIIDLENELDIYEELYIEKRFGVQESPDPYSHAEHYEDPRNCCDSSSESSFEVKYEGNCAWKGGCIVGYSSDCDFS